MLILNFVLCYLNFSMPCSYQNFVTHFMMRNLVEDLRCVSPETLDVFPEDLEEAAEMLAER